MGKDSKKQRTPGLVVKRMIEGDLQASVWVNSGKVEYYYKVTFDKSRRNRKGEEIYSKSFDPSDLASLARLVKRVQKFTKSYGPLYSWSRVIRLLRARRV